MSFVKKDTIMFQKDKKAMVKEVPKDLKEVEARKSKFVKPLSTDIQSVPVLFGKGGSKQDFEQTIEQKKQKKAEGKFKIYGEKALKMMKKLGFKANKGAGKNEQGRTDIIHVHKRQDGAGLGTIKEKPKTKEADYGDLDQEVTEDKPNSASDKLPKSTVKQSLQADDKNFLDFLMKTSKETSRQTIKRETKTTIEDESLNKTHRMIKDMKIIDETGGAYNNNFSTSGKFSHSLPRSHKQPLI